MSDVAFGSAARSARGLDEADARLSSAPLVAGAAIRIAKHNSLQIDVSSAVSGWGVRVILQFLTDDGKLSVLDRSFTVTSANSSLTRTIACPTGFLLGACLLRVGVDDQTSSVYARLTLMYGPGTAALPSLQICSGYLSRMSNVGWPSGVSQSKGSVDRIPMSRTVANPAAGAQFTLALSGFCFTRLLAVKFRMVTSATAASRQMYVRLSSFAGDYATIPANDTQSAGLTRDYYFLASGAVPGPTSSRIYGTLVNAGVPAGGSIGTISDAFQTDDQISAIQIVGHDAFDDEGASQ